MTHEEAARAHAPHHRPGVAPPTPNTNNRPSSGAPVREGFTTDRHGGTDARNDFLCAWDDIYLNRGLASAVNPWVA